VAFGGTNLVGDACPDCGAVVGDGAKFCAECGRKLDQTAPASHAPAERRQLSVMFCDLVGSTTLSSQLDPEDLRELLREYHEAATRAIRDFDGFVAEYLGDGLVVYFGYPQAHEDDAERACRAGVRIVENMGALNEILAPRLGLRLRVRVGVHTGLVVVGEVGARDVKDVVRVVGETPNVAARVQSEAPVDGVLITRETRALAGPRIDARPAGPRVLKGVATPVELFEVRGVLDALPNRPPSSVPIVDRIVAQERLRSLWTAVASDPAVGRAVVLGGEAGIGKSKLLDALRTNVEQGGGAWFDAVCSPYHRTTAFHPIASLLRRLPAPTAPDDADEELLAPLLDQPAATPSRQLGVAPIIVRRSTNQAVLRRLRAIAGPGAPFVLAIEDTHWADASTTELVDLVHAEPVPGLLLVTTNREPPSSPAVIELQPLEPDDAAILVELAAGSALSAELRRDLASRTDGVPLFATELVRTLLDAGAMTSGDDGLELRASVDRQSIPIRLQDSLMARIDRLGAAKPIAQLAATIGRTFRRDVLAAVAGVSADELAAALNQLVAAGVVTVDPESRYTFAHALLRDVAYNSMLRATRREYHGRIADALVEHFPAAAAAEPALVAHHLADAGDASGAVAWWRRTAQQANQRSASADALAALRHAAELLPRIPDSPEKARDELTTYAALGSALAAVKGYGDDETAAAYERAHALAAELPAAAELFPVLFGLVAYSTARGDFATAGSAAAQLFAAADAAGDSGLRIEAQFARGILDVYLAHFDDAIERLGDGIALYDPDRHHQLAYNYVFDPGVACLRSIGIPLTILGRHEEARRAADEAIALSERLEHPFSHASALVFSALLAALQGDEDRAASDALAAMELADSAGYPFWSLSGRILRGWALGHPDEARSALTSYRNTGTKVLLPLWCALVGDAERRSGDIDAGRTALAEAASIADDTGEHCWDSLLERFGARP
jgi:class 3 adenylate cyclase